MMDGLLPVIIALVLSAIFSIRKKKAQQEESSFPSEDSPWGDLWQEEETSQEGNSIPSSPTPLEGQKEAKWTESIGNERIPEENSVPESVSPVFGPVTSETAASSVFDSVKESERAESPKMTESLPLSPLTSTWDLSSLPVENRFQTLTLQEFKAVADDSASESDTTEVGTPFEAGFDPRMAVLYSEVLRPKYLNE